MSRRNLIQTVLGVLIAGGCIAFALRGVELERMRAAWALVDLRWIAASTGALLLAHLLRAVRWRILLAPVAQTRTTGLFSALLIGYAANSILPAHLGEFLRAFVASRNSPGLSASAAFATIVVERILDVLFLTALLGAIVVVHPFPDWLVTSGWILLGGSAVLAGLLVLGKRREDRAVGLLGAVLRPLPGPWRGKVEALAKRFLSGIVPLGSASRYGAVAGLSLAIWLGYAVMNHTCLEAFGLVDEYRLPWTVGPVVLVFTTIAVVVPSTPGYVGTYHVLCQLALAFFGIPPSEALSFAVVAHLVNIVPVIVLGFACAQREGVALLAAAQKERPA
ncbi:MAG: lysylphosphatidylglycerol synthase transmembrane domain-containing protein [Desulfobacterales bacterium]